MRGSRRLRTTGTDAERLLLAAGSAERPDPDAVRRAADGLGILPKAFVLASVLALALRGARWSGLAARSVVPLGGVGALALVTYGVVHRANIGAAPAAAPASAAVSVVASRPVGPAGDAVAPAEPAMPGPMVTAARLPGAVAAPRRAVRRAEPQSTPSADSLREQAARLDQARSQLASGDVNAALGSLDEYDRRFSGTPLAEESSVLRIEAFARRGDRAGAATLARRFLKMHPASVHAERVTALLRSVSP